MPEYSHTLIPERTDFAPAPSQVAGFLSALVELGASPVNPTLSVSRLSGEMDSHVNPFTGQIDSIARRHRTAAGSLGQITLILGGLDDFEVIMSGKGPPKVHALEFDFDGQYDFAVNCCLRQEVVSTSDWHDESPIERNVVFFGQPCSATDRQGFFCHPNTLEILEVPGAGCARFWIEVEFGKSLFPEIGDSLALLHPSIVDSAEAVFGIRFKQGCHWCA